MASSEAAESFCLSVVVMRFHRLEPTDFVMAKVAMTVDIVLKMVAASTLQ